MSQLVISEFPQPVEDYFTKCKTNKEEGTYYEKYREFEKDAVKYHLIDQYYLFEGEIYYLNKKLGCIIYARIDLPKFLLRIESRMETLEKAIHTIHDIL